jgi:hypothetical protein
MFASCPNRSFSPVPLGVGDRLVAFDCCELAVGPYRDARPCMSVVFWVGGSFDEWNLEVEMRIKKRRNEEHDAYYIHIRRRR